MYNSDIVVSKHKYHKVARAFQQLHSGHACVRMPGWYWQTSETAPSARRSPLGISRRHTEIVYRLEDCHQRGQTPALLVKGRQRTPFLPDQEITIVDWRILWKRAVKYLGVNTIISVVRCSIALSWLRYST